ncbi:MAG: efflux RND transporter permease subunit [Hyphomicrobiales bacterium]|nr:efflux RND transporter permease subunit [Hyphomicrobiales bacterium]
MTLSDLSIRRPVLAAVVSLLIIVFGLAALLRLPVRELPDIDSAVVSVTTNYVGASPETIDTDITEVIEGSVSGISGIKSIRSESRGGRSRTVLEFETGRNIDEAANDVRDAVGRVRGQLPDDASEPRIVKSDSDADPVMRLAVTSDRMSAAEITDYVQRYVIDRITTLDGVADVDIFGDRRYAVRIWLDRRAMAARNLAVTDVGAALTRNNVELPAGEVESERRQFTLRLDSRIVNIAQFRDIVIDHIGGYPVRLRDIARIERGVENDQTLVRVDGVEAVGLGVMRQSQANTVAISNAVRAALDGIRPTLPAGMDIRVGSDDATFIAASIREVLIALSLSLTLVVLVILIFLLSFRATLIPFVTIPVSLIGCFILIYALGFSINVLTLLALLLGIGLVVDDAIVMLENIQRRIGLGESRLVASVRGARQVTFAVIATSLTLVAVFVPISFLQGQAGRLFTEFGFVMASAVIISTFVALSLCPALASKVLANGGKSGAGGASRGVMARVGRLYRGALTAALGMPLVVILLALVFAGASYQVFRILPRELTPKEDRAIVFVSLTAPQGSTAAFTDTQTREVEELVAPLRESGEVKTVYSIVGSGGRPYRAFVVLRLAPWEERDRDAAALVTELAPKMSAITGARASVGTPAGLGLRGGNSPLRVVVGGPDFDSVKEWAQALLARAEENRGLRDPEIDFEQNQPQLSLRLDRARADDLGISVETIATTLQTMFASRAITTYIDRGREYPVIVQAQPSDRQRPDDISNVFVRSGDGKTLVPLSALASISEDAAAPSLRRYARLPAITISAALNEGYSLGAAVDFMEQAASEILPVEATLGFTGQTQQFQETSAGVAVTFALALLIVYLVLAAQFESFVHPAIIMLSVPLAIAAAIYSLWFAGLSVNLYSQIGIILLIGLMAKNGILIVEFANQLRDEGYSVRDAVIEASVLRLRPIVMTVVSTVLGAMPLVLAFGAGAESRSAIGTVIVGGLGFASILTLFLTPVLYDVFAGYTRPRGAVEKLLEAELGAHVEQGVGAGATKR